MTLLVMTTADDEYWEKAVKKSLLVAGSETKLREETMLQK
jgi:hypothetical protein